jgi:ribosomal protein S18 acetylase RimI-like enzyme
MTVDGPRAPRPDERADLIAHLNRVMREEVDGEATYELDWPHVIDPANLENLRIIKLDGQVVSSTGIYWHDSRIGDVQLRVGGINGVSTDTAYRRRGLASLVLRACIERMAELGCHLSLLSTGVPSWYRQLGWEYAGRRREYHFDRGNWPLLPADAGIRLRSGTAADFDALAAVHDARRLGAVRSPAQMRTVMTRRRARTWVAERGGVPVAYLWGREARGGGAVRLSEYGGPAEAVLPALRALFEQWDDPSIRTSTQTPEERTAGRKPTLHVGLSAPDLPDSVTAALDRLGILYAHAYLDMIRIENPAGLLAAYRSEGIDATDHGDEIEFQRGAERLRLARTQAAKLLLGPERPAAFAAERLPLPFHEWPTDLV